jgi:hypothetical protein
LNGISQFWINGNTEIKKTLGNSRLRNEESVETAAVLRSVKLLNGKLRIVALLLCLNLKTEQKKCSLVYKM